MLASKKFLSLPIISLKEGQQIGFVRNMVINPKTKSIVALVVDPKGFFKEQRIIPFNKVVSLGENAITISTESQVEKATNLPDILELLREKATILGIKVITESGKTLGVTDEFYINPLNGQIASLEISEGKIEGLFNGKARLSAEDILTIGPNVIVVDSDCESRLEIYNKGISENFKSFLHIASSKVTEKSQRLKDYWKKTIKDKDENALEVQDTWDDSLIESEEITLHEACTSEKQDPSEASDEKSDRGKEII